MTVRKAIARLWLFIIFVGGAVAMPIAIFNHLEWWAAIFFVWGFVAVLMLFACSIGWAVDELDW